MRFHIRLPSAALAVATAASASGCGLGAGRGTSDVSLTVTRAFGAGRIGATIQSKVPGSETVMRMLERSFHIRTRYGGGFVESINGHSGTSSHLDWFYYVNGIEAPMGAASTPIHRGDRIWWDLHDWSATNTTPAVVGSFPEPFVHGIGGKRLPTALECAPDAMAACAIVSKQLAAAGVPVASQLLGTGSGTNSLTVVVAPWRELRPQLAANLIERGPAASGVYARFNGSSLQLLDPHGRIARTLERGAGLIAATATHSSTPVWLITGTDLGGVLTAARAMTAKRLSNHFALAVDRTGDVPIPLRGAS